MLDRAYSTFLIKSVSEDERIIEGFASTPRPDRDGDILDSQGAVFSLPMPFLWQHNQSQPVGHVLAAKITPDGWYIRAQIAKGVTGFIEDAWRLIKSGLVRGLSVGVKPVDVERIAGTLGLRVKKWNWLETSAVTVPANAETSILLVKSLDTELRRAALGQQGAGVSRPGAAGSRSGTTMNVSERITALRATLQTKNARLTELTRIETEDGIQLDAAQMAESDTLAGEVPTLTKQLQRLQTLEVSSALLATPVSGSSLDLGSVSRGGGHPHIEIKSNLPPGIEFARFVLCKAAAYLSNGSVSALDIAKSRYPDNPRIQMLLKAAVPPMLSTDATNTGLSALVEARTLTDEFIAWLRPKTIVGRFGANGIPSLRNVPFNIRVIGQTSGASAWWVGQAKPKRVTRFDTSPTSLGFAKIATISVMSDELARFSSPNAETMTRDELSAAVIERMDIDFIDPAKVAVANVSPASITYGITPITSSGTDAAALRADVGRLLAAFLSADNPPESAVLIMPSVLALSLSLMVNTLGQREFPDITMNGGTLLGLPVITSQHAVIGGAYYLIIVNAQDIFLADDGGVSVDVSREASIEMSDDPESDTGEVVNMFQNNLLAIRAERFVNWARRREQSVEFMDAVAYVPEVVT